MIAKKKGKVKVMKTELAVQFDGHCEATKCRFTASRTSGQSPVKQGDCFGEERLAMTLDPK